MSAAPVTLMGIEYNFGIFLNLGYSKNITSRELAAVKKRFYTSKISSIPNGKLFLKVSDKTENIKNETPSEFMLICTVSNTPKKFFLCSVKLINNQGVYLFYILSFKFFN